MTRAGLETPPVPFEETSLELDPNPLGLVALELLRPADGLNAGDVAGFTPGRAQELIDAGAAKLHGEQPAADDDEAPRRRGGRRT